MQGQLHNLWGQVQDEALLSPGHCGPAPLPHPGSRPWACDSNTWTFNSPGLAAQRPRLNPPQPELPVCLCFPVCQVSVTAGQELRPGDPSNTFLPCPAPGGHWQGVLPGTGWRTGRRNREQQKRKGWSGWNPERGNGAEGAEAGGEGGVWEPERREALSCMTPPKLPIPTYLRATRAGWGDTRSSLRPLDSRSKRNSCFSPALRDISRERGERPGCEPGVRAGLVEGSAVRASPAPGPRPGGPCFVVGLKPMKYLGVNSCQACNLLARSSGGKMSMYILNIRIYSKTNYRLVKHYINNGYTQREGGRGGRTEGIWEMPASAEEPGATSPRGLKASHAAGEGAGRTSHAV